MFRLRVPVVAFLAADSLSLLGNSAFLVVFPWLVLAHTGSPAETSVVTALTTIPTAAATVAAGRIIDRVGAKRFSIAATAGAAVAAAGFGLVNSVGGLDLGALVGLGMCCELFVTPATTARDALMGEIAQADGLPVERLAGIRQVLFSAAYVAGPAVAGVLLTATTPVTILWMVAGTWLAAAVLTTRLPRESFASAGPGGPQHESRSVWRLVRSRPAVWAAVVIGFGSCLITQPMTSVILPAHFRSLHEPSRYGFTVSAFAVGAILGGLAYAGLGERARRGVYVAAVGAVTIGMAVFAVLPDFWVLALALGVGGIGSGLAAPLLLVAVTAHTDDNERGRALGVYNAASMGASPIGLGFLSLLLTVTTIRVGAVAVLAVWAAVAVYAVARTSVLVPRSRQDSDSC